MSAPKPSECYTVHDWHKALAQAIRDRERHTIEELQGHAEGWLMPQDEIEALVDLGAAAIELIYDWEREHPPAAAATMAEGENESADG